MSGDITFGIRLTADGSGFVGEVRLSRKELQGLGDDARKAGANAEQGARGVDKFGKEAKQSADEARKMHTQVNSLGNGLKMLYGYIGYTQLKQFTADIINTNVAMERQNVALKSVFGTTEAAAREFGFLRAEAERLGLPLLTITEEYKKLSAAANDTVLEGQGVRDIFIAVTEAGTALQLDQQRMGLILFAVSQMMSKGAVSMEELRQQLGESLPGAFNMAAKAMGMTTAEFSKMVESGNVMATDMLPKLARELHNTYGKAATESAQSANSEINRYQNTLLEIKTEFGTGGFMDGYIKALESIRDLMRDPAFKEFSKLMGQLAGNSVAYATQVSSYIPGAGMFSQSADMNEQLHKALQEQGINLPEWMRTSNWTSGKLFESNTRPRATVDLPPPLPISSFQGVNPNGDAPKGPPKKVTDAIAQLEAEAAAVQRLYAARQQGQAEYAATKSLIEGETMARDLGLDAKSAEYKSIVDLTMKVADYQNFIRDVDATEKTHAATVTDIERRYAKLPGAYTDATTAAQAWRVEALAGLDETKAGYQEFANQVDAIYSGLLTQAYEENLRASREFSAGATRAFNDYADGATNAADNAQSAMSNSMSRMEDDLVNMKFSVASFADFVEKEMYRAFVRQKVTGPVSQTFSELFNFSLTPSGISEAGDAGATTVQTGHTGAWIGGAGGGRTSVDASVFQGAPRFHSGGQLGLQPGEVPFIGKKGEIIGWPDQLAQAFGGNGAAPQVVVNFIDQGGAIPKNTQVTQRSGGPGITVIDIMVPAMEQAMGSGRLDQTMGQFGGARQPVPGA